MLFNIAFFLIIAAIAIAVVKPKSKSDIWLFSILIPIVAFLPVAVFDKFFSDNSYTNISYYLAAALGESLVSIVICFITLFIYLKKKLIAGDQFKFPKGLIVAIIVFAALGFVSEWGNSRRNKSIVEREGQELNSQKEGNERKSTQDNTNELSNDVEEARKVLPELVAFLKQGLPVTREGMSWTDVEIDGYSLNSYFVIDENFMNFDEVTKDIESNSLDFFKTVNANNQQLIDKLILAEYDYAVEFKSSSSGKTKWITILASEIKDAYK